MKLSSFLYVKIGYVTGLEIMLLLYNIMERILLLGISTYVKINIHTAVICFCSKTFCNLSPAHFTKLFAFAEQNHGIVMTTT